MIGIKNQNTSENPKRLGVLSDCDNEKSKNNDYKNNPIKTLIFECDNKKNVCKVFFNEYYDGWLVLYRSSKPYDASSYTIDRIICKKDIINESEMVKKFYLEHFNKDDLKYGYCLAVNTGSSKNDTHFSEPFQFCKSQNKFMLIKDAKTCKNINKTTWVILGLAVAALSLVTLFSNLNSYFK